MTRLLAPNTVRRHWEPREPTAQQFAAWDLPPQIRRVTSTALPRRWLACSAVFSNALQSGTSRSPRRAISRDWRRGQAGFSCGSADGRQLLDVTVNCRSLSDTDRGRQGRGLAVPIRGVPSTVVPAAAVGRLVIERGLLP